jgi:hypothetical protein
MSYDEDSNDNFFTNNIQFPVGDTTYKPFSEQHFNEQHLTVRVKNIPPYISAHFFHRLMMICIDHHSETQFNGKILIVVFW